MNEMELLESMNMKTVTDANGKRHLLSVPITQHINDEQKAAFEGKDAVAVRCSAIAGDRVLAVMHKPSFFDNRKEEICTRTFGTFSAKHPKAETIMAQGNWLISAESTRFFERIKFNDGMDKYRYTPREIVE
jgi:ATP sulfurylase